MYSWIYTLFSRRIFGKSVSNGVNLEYMVWKKKLISMSFLVFVLLLHVLLVLNCFFFHCKPRFFISSVCFFCLSFHSLGMLPVFITGFVFLYVFSTCLLVSVRMCACIFGPGWLYVSVGVCLVLWPHSVSQYRASLFSVPSCSASSGSGTVMYGSVCGYPRV